MTSATQKTINNKVAMNWQTMSTRMGMEAGGNGNQWEWEGNGNKTRLNLGLEMGMGMNHWKLEGMRLKKTFPLISSSYLCEQPDRKCLYRAFVQKNCWIRIRNQINPEIESFVPYSNVKNLISPTCF